MYLDVGINKMFNSFVNEFCETCKEKTPHTEFADGRVVCDFCSAKESIMEREKENGKDVDLNKILG